MKKLICLLLISILSLSVLSGCSKNDDSKQADEETTVSDNGESEIGGDIVPVDENGEPIVVNEPEPFPDKLETPITEPIIKDVLSESDTTHPVIGDMLARFREKTGVNLDVVYVDINTVLEKYDSDMYTFAESMYKKTFKDGTHCLLAYSEWDGTFRYAIYFGDDAASWFSEKRLERLCNMISGNLSSGFYMTVDEAISKAFFDCYEL